MNFNYSHMAIHGNNRDNRSTRVCFNCNKPGHFARECTCPRMNQNNNHTQRRYNTRDVYYLDDFEDFNDYEDEEDDYYEYDDDEYEVYLNTRSGKPYPSNPVSKNRRTRRSESGKEEPLRTV